MVVKARHFRKLTVASHFMIINLRLNRIAGLLSPAILLCLGCGTGTGTPPVTVTPVLPKPPPVVAKSNLAAAANFVDVAAASGIKFSFHSDEVPDRFWLPEIMGGGAAWFDFDLDRVFDLYLMNGQIVDGEPNAEYTNRLFRGAAGGMFEDVTADSRAGDLAYGQGCAVGDFDADGFPDLYLANYGANVLLHNNGDGTFSDATAAAAVGDTLWSTSTTWFDIDEDGDLDLYVVNYVNMTFANHHVCQYDGVDGYCGPGNYEAEPDRVYLNNGDGSFTESAAEMGLLGDDGKGLAIAVLDLDDDARPEIYIANDMTANFLFTRGRGSSKLFQDVAMESGCALSSTGVNEASMGIACADFDGDLMADLFLTHFYAAKNTLYSNLGGLIFEDTSRGSKIAATSFETLGFGTIPLDFDADGAVDLFIANGHVLGPKKEPGPMCPQLLHNRGKARFADISRSAGEYFQGKYLGRGAASADYDRDGDLDIVVTHVHAPLALLRNDTKTENHYIGFELFTQTRIPPIGARVVVTCDGQRFVRHVTAGGSYLSTSDPALLFGLGVRDEPVQIEVFWPSGQTDRWSDLPVDRYWQLTPGQRPRSDH